jgi:hypothetical protein
VSAVHRVNGRQEKNPQGYFNKAGVHDSKKSDDFFSSSSSEMFFRTLTKRRAG